MKTIMGQCLDLLSTNFGKKPNLDLFTMDQYNSIVKYKTSYYTFILPITIAMHYVSISEFLDMEKEILLYFNTNDIFRDLGRNKRSRDV